MSEFASISTFRPQLKKVWSEPMSYPYVEVIRRFLSVWGTVFVRLWQGYFQIHA